MKKRDKLIEQLFWLLIAINIYLCLLFILERQRSKSYAECFHIQQDLIKKLAAPKNDTIWVKEKEKDTIWVWHTIE